MKFVAILVITLGFFGGIDVAQAQMEYSHLMFHSCALPGWTCVNDTDGLSSTITSITYECNQVVQSEKRLISGDERYDRYNNYNRYQPPVYDTVVTQVERSNYTLDLSEWEKLPIKSLFIQGCGVINLKMHTVKKLKLQKFHIEDAMTLNIEAPQGDSTQHPPNLAFRSIDFIPVIPARFISLNNTRKIEFYNTTIGLLERNAISIKTPLTSFLWKDVGLKAVKDRAISVILEKESRLRIQGSQFPLLRPLSLLIQGGSVLIEDSHFEVIQETSMRISSESFNFTHNTVRNQAGRFAVTSSDVTMSQNTWNSLKDIKDIINWNTTISSELPEMTYFAFNDNSMQVVVPPTNEISDPEAPPPPPIFPHKLACTSKVYFLEKKGECYRNIENPDKILYGLPNSSVSIWNLYICDNAYEGVVSTVPHSWDPIQSLQLCRHEVKETETKP